MITYIVFTYNQKEYIGSALKSLEIQSIPIDQLIIADDGSQDGTKNAIEKFIQESKIKKIDYLSNDKNIGFIASFNNAIKKSDGDYIFIQAGDDYSSPFRTINALKIFENKKSEVICTNYMVIDSHGNIRKKINRSGIYLEGDFFIKKGSGLPNFGLAFTKNFLNFFKEIPSILKNEDDYITMSAILFGGIYVIDSYDYFYRITPNSLSSWSLLENDNRALRKAFHSDQKNRTENYRAWLDLNIQNNSNENTITLLKKRISLSIFYENLYDYSILKRFLFATKYAKLIKVMDLIFLIFGKNSPVVVRNLRRLKLKF